jgi:hypothetical protein
MKTVKQVLIEARGLVEKGWCQGTFARTASGEEAHSISPDAHSHCALGAVRAVTLPAFPFIEARVAAREALASFLPPAEDQDAQDQIVVFNDAPERTQADVLALFDRAIAAAE